MPPSSGVMTEVTTDWQYISMFREYQKARASYEAALETLAVGKIADEKKPAVEAELRSALEQVEAETEQMAVAVLGGGRFSIRRPHTQFPSMSEAVTIRYEEDVGRHAVATQNIEPGDVILVEKPLAWTVSVNNFEHFCQNCVNNVGRTPIPSPSHESGVFCCYDCLTHFQTTFPFDDLDFVQLFSSGTSEGSASVMLAFRLVDWTVTPAVTGVLSCPQVSRPEATGLVPGEGGLSV